MDDFKQAQQLKREVDNLKSQIVFSGYQGTSASDFTTTNLPQHGDYGYQTTDNEVHMNCNGTIRAISTAAL